MINNDIFLAITLGVSVCAFAYAIISRRKYVKKYNKKYKEEKLVVYADRLNGMFEMQKELQSKFYEGSLPADEPQIMGNNILALVAELGEVMQEDKRWKSWCKNPPEPNFKDKKKEIIDCWHFIINLCLYSDMDVNELFDLFTHKNKENVNRQENNY